MRLEDWLDDLCVRFIINLPGDDLSSVERICFQVEEAQWYYEDFIRPLDPNLPSLNLRNFSLRIFAHCPLLSAFSQSHHMAAFEEFMVYKRRIPVRGAIMLNHAMDSVVLVKGWKKGAAWSYPRGKINKDEDDLICAIREVYEETGFDLQAAGLVPTTGEVKPIALSIRDQDVRLYVFRDVPMDTNFEPRTRKEISKIQWWRISDLPAFKNKEGQAMKAQNANKFYMVASFQRSLSKWIAEQRRADAKRAASSQYLTAAISHDEFLTEEDMGAESNQEQSQPKASIDTLEGATAALKILLKLQPPTQGLQTESVKSPVAKDTGSELLAYLQGNGQPANSAVPPQPPPQTPLDHIYTQSQQPKTPHHQQPRPPHASSLAPPPSFPMQPPSSSFSYQDHSQPRFDIQSHPAIYEQRQPQNVQQPYPHQGPPHHQSQHLVHPQPLPPHVQRAVFTGGPVHSPMMPRPVQQQNGNYHQNPVSIAAPNPQFPGLHAPMVPSVPKQSPPKLTSHSLALLDAFKARDQANGEPTAASDLPLRRFEHDAKQRPPQELPAETPQNPSVDYLSLPKAQESSKSVLGAPSNSSRPVVSEAHKSTLLGLFKSPTIQNAVPLQHSATVFPISATPSAVELSAVEHIPIPTPSNGQPPSRGEAVRYGSGKPGSNIEANLPFMATSILARPSHSSGEQSRQASGKAPEIQKWKLQPARSGRQDPRSAHDEKVKIISEKPFQPQILKRPPQGTYAANNPPAFSPSSLASLPLRPLQEVPSTLPAQPVFDRRSSQPAVNRDALLSLFGKSQPSVTSLPVPATNESTASKQPSEALADISARTRVGSLASGDNSRRTSQTPMSPADRNFLLKYLDSVAKS